MLRPLHPNPILIGISLCHVCSCHAIEECNGCGRRRRRVGRLQRLCLGAGVLHARLGAESPLRFLCPDLAEMVLSRMQPVPTLTVALRWNHECWIGHNWTTGETLLGSLMVAYVWWLVNWCTSSQYMQSPSHAVNLTRRRRMSFDAGWSRLRFTVDDAMDWCLVSGVIGWVATIKHNS
eukprot:COSAG01_NODE_2233_length_8112_cov_41.569699_4_plen_178_part_00